MSIEDGGLIMSELSAIKSLLAALVERQTIKDWYTTQEVARLTGRDEFTVREWCRHGRIAAVKRRSGRGPHASWAIGHAELQRYQREGLLPLPQRANRRPARGRERLAGPGPAFPDSRGLQVVSTRTPHPAASPTGSADLNRQAVAWRYEFCRPNPVLA